ncbi:hypothetical protein C5167_011644 [Papaver somniferum]|uniref:F-box domain-containing protein n=1 Tax=Papaver somniferum TaxID=3469 RepID=A0A4Y7K6J4_PAPSO|nr:hypothetical protein C5167_011644 [Papaver somniferum]
MLLLSSKGSTSHEDDLVLENSSASVVASNCDLLKQILLCVPMKPLMLFKCVSTSWLSLFSDPLFVQSYTLRNHRLSNRGLFLHKMSMGGVDPKFEFVFADGRSFTGSMPFQTSFPKESTFVITEHSCNGLICCSLQ